MLVLHCQHLYIL